MPKLLMNCDQVFDVLTRGPFPTGAASDAAVEHHLRCCHDCRELAEALQPAVELLHEAIAPEDANGLPEYQGALASARGSVATAEAWRPTPLAVRRLSRPQVGQRRPSKLQSIARFTAALVLFGALGLLVWGVISTAKHTASHRERIPTRLDQAGLLTLASLKLPAGCLPREMIASVGASELPGVPPAAINQEALRCCTECHNAAHPERAMLGTFSPLQQSCVACHSL
jgi:hypothetical protein